MSHAYRISWIAATSLLTVVVIVYGLPAMHMFLRTRAVLGSATGDCREAVLRLLGVAQQGRRLIWPRTLLLYGGVGALLIGLLTREWLALVIAAAPFVMIWWMRIRTTTPPIVLLLGTSTPTALNRQRDIKRRVSPLRVVSLLDVSVPWNPDFANELILDSFRTSNEDDWWAVVMSLIQHAPVVAIDAAAATAGVMREGHHILGSAVARKCLFLTPPDGFAPILDQLLPTSQFERPDLRVVSYEEAPRTIEAMVAELTP